MKSIKKFVNVLSVAGLLTVSAGLFAAASDKDEVKLNRELVKDNTLQLHLEDVNTLAKAYQISLKINGNVKLDTLNFSNQVKSKVQTNYVYHQDLNEIDVYVTSTDSLLDENDDIDVGTLSVKGTTGESFDVVPVANSLKIVTAANTEYEVADVEVSGSTDFIIGDVDIDEGTSEGGNGSGSGDEGVSGGGNGSSGEGTQGGGSGSSGEGTQGGGNGSSGEGTQGGGNGSGDEGTQGGGSGSSGEGTQGGGSGSSGEGTQGGGNGSSGEGTQGGGNGSGDEETQGGGNGSSGEGTSGGGNGSSGEGTQGSGNDSSDEGTSEDGNGSESTDGTINKPATDEQEENEKLPQTGEVFNRVLMVLGILLIFIASFLLMKRSRSK